MDQNIKPAELVELLKYLNIFKMYTEKNEEYKYHKKLAFILIKFTLNFIDGKEEKIIECPRQYKCEIRECFTGRLRIICNDAEEECKIFLDKNKFSSIFFFRDYVLIKKMHKSSTPFINLNKQKSIAKLYIKLRKRYEKY